MARGQRHLRAALAGRSTSSVQANLDEGRRIAGLRRAWGIIADHEGTGIAHDLRAELDTARDEGDGRMERAAYEQLAQHLSILLGYEYSSVEGSLSRWTCHVCEQPITAVAPGAFSQTRDQAVHVACVPAGADVGFVRQTNDDPIGWICDALDELDAHTRSLLGRE